ncbi:hypothetical protein XENTR_v10019100 [Xenopus tropicalis]|uniref:Heat shock protein 30C n=1 Tax=Xenopus tropicalis TaxID=8364 RepID=A0A6I8Q018_XENTR|nr:heat shock protein 30C [Xenopus tropicalis]KAE8593379.1 hypothetical protein XENTR_v10019100 [Xenopus tropicalis]|eukprot:XP_017950961.1 PREDICTED: heat shock protein 30C-like [Xenopus tropicalis]
MFPVSLLQPSHSPLCPCSQPALTLWPATRLILGQLGDDILSMRNDMERRMQCVNEAYRLLSQDMDMRRITDQSRQPRATETEGTSPSSGKDGKDHFELTLDVRDFSPHELTVKMQGRRVIVIGKQERKSDSENGSYVHEYREWKREAELPEGVNPEQVVCSFSKDGHLHIQAPRLALPPAPERPIPISMDPAPRDAQEIPPDAQNSNADGEQQMD